MDKVVIVGASGSGKSRLARRLAAQIGAERIDLDELFHGPDWAPTPTVEFRAAVADAIAVAKWVVAGNYSTVSDIVHGAADTIVWLDLPRWRTVGRVLRRSARRVVLREELWNGNRETLGNLFTRDPDRSIVAAAWQTNPSRRKQYAGFAAGQFWAHADVRRLTTPRQVRAFLDSAHR